MKSDVAWPQAARVIQPADLHWGNQPSAKSAKTEGVQSWLKSSLVIHPFLSCLGSSQATAKYIYISGPQRPILICLYQMATSVKQLMFVSPLSGCLRQDLLYFRPDITQQAVILINFAAMGTDSLKDTKTNLTFDVCHLLRCRALMSPSCWLVDPPSLQLYFYTLTQGRKSP